jgi:hypothetical protein
MPVRVILVVGIREDAYSSGDNIASQLSLHAIFCALHNESDLYQHS